MKNHQNNTATIFEQLQAAGGDVKNASSAGFITGAIARAQRILKSLLALKEELDYAFDEGLVEVTVRSRTKTVTLAVPITVGAALEEALRGHVENLCDTQADSILWHHRDLAAGGDCDTHQMLDLLLTPVGADGKALPTVSTSAPTASDAQRCPLLPSPALVSNR
jgi:hypothetical protein